MPKNYGVQNNRDNLSFGLSFHPNIHEKIINFTYFSNYERLKISLGKDDLGFTLHSKHLTSDFVRQGGRTHNVPNNAYPHRKRTLTPQNTTDPHRCITFYLLGFLWSRYIGRVFMSQIPPTIYGPCYVSAPLWNCEIMTYTSNFTCKQIRYYKVWKWWK